LEPKCKIYKGNKKAEKKKKKERKIKIKGPRGSH
jgi:hypothetical protein